MKITLLRIIFLTIIGLSTTACTTFMDVTTDGPIEQDPGKRTFGEFWDDSQLERIIKVNLKKTAPGLDQAHINVFVFNGVVLLTGEVPSKELRELAGKTVRDIHNTRRVHNELLVQSNSTFFSRTNDNWIHTKVRARLRSNDQVDPDRVKVIVENRIVYLMGLLTQQDTNIITEIVANTSGVEKVVRAIEYIDATTASN